MNVYMSDPSIFAVVNLLRGFVSEEHETFGGKRLQKKHKQMTGNDFCLKIIFVDHIFPNQKPL